MYLFKSKNDFVLNILLPKIRSKLHNSHLMFIYLMYGHIKGDNNVTKAKLKFLRCYFLSIFNELVTATIDIAMKWNLYEILWKYVPHYRMFNFIFSVGGKLERRMCSFTASTQLMLTHSINSLLCIFITELSVNFEGYWIKAFDVGFKRILVNFEEFMGKCQW